MNWCFSELRFGRRHVLAMAVAALGMQLFGAGVSAEPIDRPARGSGTRLEILDAARPAFEAETGGPVEFMVRSLNEVDDWVFGDVRVQRPGGAAIDWAQTKYANEVSEGRFNPEEAYFLLRLSTRRFGNNWTPVEISVGSSSAVLGRWRQSYNLPSDLFASESKAN